MEQLSINSQWQSFLRYSAQHAKQGIVAELDCGVTVCWTKTTMAFTNGFFLSSSVSEETDLHQRLEGIKEYVTKAQPTFSWMLFIEPELLAPRLRERAKDICLVAEFAFAGNVKCMQTTSLLPPVRPLPPTEIKFATTQNDVYDAMLLNTRAHNMKMSVADSMIEQHALITDFTKQLCSIVSIDDKPVSTATTELLDDCLYVSFVATPTEHRQHGYAEVAMRASIERALQTWPNTKYGVVLHASNMGQPIYKRLGFRDISHLDMYVYEPIT